MAISMQCGFPGNVGFVYVNYCTDLRAIVCFNMILHTTEEIKVMWRALHMVFFCSFLFLSFLLGYHVVDWLMPDKFKLHGPKHKELT